MPVDVLNFVAQEGMWKIGEMIGDREGRMDARVCRRGGRPGQPRALLDALRKAVPPGERSRANAGVR